MVTVKVPADDKVPPGTHDGRFVGVEEKTSDGFGDFWAWEVEVLTEDGPVTVSGASSRRFGPNAKARRWAEAASDRALKPNEDVDFDRLAGRPVRVVVEDAGAFSKVVDILPPRRKETDGSREASPPRRKDTQEG